MDTDQRAQQIGTGLTNRFRSQLSAYENYSSNKNKTLQGMADSYRTNLIEQMGKTDSGKLLNDMMQGQTFAEGSASALALSQLGLKGAKSFYGRRLARQQQEVKDARQRVDDAFPEEEEADDTEAPTEPVEETPSSENPVSSQGVAESAPAEDFSGASSGISGVSESGAIQVSPNYTPEPTTTATTGESDISSQLPTEGLGATADPAPAPPTDIPGGYTGSSQLGLSEAGMEARSQALQSYSDIYSQAPRQVLPTESTTLAETPAGETEAEAGQRLSNLLDTSAEQGATDVDFSTQGAMESEAIARGAPTIDYGAGPKALTQTELAQPTPSVNQPQAPRPTEPVSEDSPFNPSGGATETSTGTSSSALDANTHRSLVQDEGSQGSQNVEQVKADLGTEDTGAGTDIGAQAGAETSEGLSAEQLGATEGLSAGLEGVEATSGIMAGIETASSVLGVLAPLGMLGGLIYEGISAQKQYDDEQKKMDQASSQLQGEIGVEDNESQFTAGRPAFGSMSLAPNLDLATSS